MFRTLALLAALLLAVYTQVYKLTAVPGLHFDEAWQGLFAHRIASEAGFLPTAAMNSYTSPIVHYLLAGAFKLFGPTLTAMRGTFAAMNLLTLGLLVALLLRLREKKAAVWFALLWALLPLSVHDHRFYVEVTGFFGLCLAVMLWGCALWQERPAISSTLLIVSVLAGAYSHVLFIAIFISAVLVGALSFPREFRSPRTRAVVALTAALLIPLTLRMGAGLHKKLPYLLAGGLGAMACWAVVVGRLPRLRYAYRVITILSLPFLAAFVLLMWNGFWPYAQATGQLDLEWLPLNAAIFAALAITQIRSRQILPNLLWNIFAISFLFTSLMIFKQSPRYYMAPAILAMLWCAVRLARVRSQELQVALGIAFVAFNLWAFRAHYIRPFEQNGSNTVEFKVWIYHDNGRDFRPFQKAFDWAVAKNCQRVLRWVEDDRFLLPVQFLQLTAPKPSGSCAYARDDLFFSHIENLSKPDTPPANAPHVKLLAHFREWGDLAFWIRK